MIVPDTIIYVQLFPNGLVQKTGSTSIIRTPNHPEPSVFINHQNNTFLTDVNGKQDSTSYGKQNSAREYRA